nr:MAG TPA: hypothetical protein [Caudoviricetes sp.]DAT07321.1 MAG TPA: hypothetical protein [Caudoviricetes sp.]
MKLRITHRIQETGKIEISVDTEINNQQIYSKTFDTKEAAIKSINNILTAAKIDEKSLQSPIEFENEFGSIIFDVNLDFSKEDEYKQFVEDIFKQELIK